MTEALYERYKDALRRGHVAALRGRFEQALAAYIDAAEIATERPLPWASIGSVRLRMGDAAEALAAYDAALARASRDEAALLGRAEALTRLNRRALAADALDLAADIQQQAGRQPEALDTARRALELAESKARRRYVAALARELRGASDLDQDAEQALARALQILYPPNGIESVQRRGTNVSWKKEFRGDINMKTTLSSFPRGGVWFPGNSWRKSHEEWGHEMCIRTRNGNSLPEFKCFWK